MTGQGWHISRSWEGTRVEDECPCPQEPCGFVTRERSVPECRHHPIGRAKSIRRWHSAADCPGFRSDANDIRIDMRHEDARPQFRRSRNW